MMSSTVIVYVSLGQYVYYLPFVWFWSTSGPTSPSRVPGLILLSDVSSTKVSRSRPGVGLSSFGYIGKYFSRVFQSGDVLEGRGKSLSTFSTGRLSVSKFSVSRKVLHGTLFIKNWVKFAYNG